MLLDHRLDGGAVDRLVLGVAGAGQGLYSIADVGVLPGGTFSQANA
jgi:hypothetical protein